MSSARATISTVERIASLQLCNDYVSCLSLHVRGRGARGATGTRRGTRGELSTHFPPLARDAMKEMLYSSTN